MFALRTTLIIGCSSGGCSSTRLTRSYTRLTFCEDEGVPTDRFGFELPLLLAGASRPAMETLHAQLATRGHPDARPIHGFALQAIGADGVTVSELGRRLRVSKQAATKTAASLEQLGYVRRLPHPNDARAIRLQRTSHGDELLNLSAEIFDG